MITLLLPLCQHQPPATSHEAVVIMELAEKDNITFSMINYS